MQILNYQMAIISVRAQSIVSQHLYKKYRYFQKFKLRPGSNQFNVTFYCNDGRFYYALKQYYQAFQPASVRLVSLTFNLFK